MKQLLSPPRMLIAAWGIVALAWAVPAAAQQVSLTMADGKVSLTTQNATIRQILAEWERLGMVKVVGADRLVAEALTLSLTDVSEKQALDIVLRAAPGFMMVERDAAAPGSSPSASRYDRIVILPKATVALATATPGRTPNAAAGRAGVNAPAPAMPIDTSTVQEPVEVADNDDDEPPMPQAPVVNPAPGANGNELVGAGVGMQQGGGPGRRGRSRWPESSRHWCERAAG